MTREAIILAGGFGTRLRALISDVPKPMAPINGVPFLQIILTAMAAKGFSRIIISLGYMAETIYSFFGDTFMGMEIVYVIEKSPLGTGGAARLAIEHIKTDHAFILNGDTFLDIEAKDIDNIWENNRRPILVTRWIDDCQRYGKVNIHNGIISGLNEKGVSGPGFINAGCYVFARDQLKNFPMNFHFSLETDYILESLERIPWDYYETYGYFIDIGIPSDYQRAQKELKLMGLI